jgi:hypothetical protein
MPLQVSTFYSALGKRKVHFGQHLGVLRGDVPQYPHWSSWLAGFVLSMLLPELRTIFLTKWLAKKMAFPCLSD